MQFPRWAGFGGAEDLQACDGFARTVLGALLLDIAERLPAGHATQPALQALARREADCAAAAKLADRHGGWSYFPGLPDLPPDLDSLAAVIALFARAAPQHLALCERPIALALAQRGDGGGCRTWLVDPQDPPAAAARMQAAVTRHWGDTVDLEVNARFGAALQAAGHPAAAQIAAFLRGTRLGDGSWPVTWYASPLVALDLAQGLPDLACTAALDFVRRTVRADGGWGFDGQSATLDTALAVDLLAGADAAAVAAGAAWLCAEQTRRGAWQATPWIRMDVGRAQGAATHRLLFGCDSITTAYALRALLRCL
jgi:hypothetical protein